MGHTEGTAVLALRRKAMMDPPPVDFRVRGDQLAVTIKAWNAHAAGEKVKLLRYQSSEPFPTLRMRPGQKIVHRHRA